jgi:hypothetical protein
MHIVEKHYLGLELKTPARAHVLREAAVFAASAFSEAVGDDSVAAKEEAAIGMQLFLLNRNIKSYLFTETAQALIEKIKVAESFDLEILRKLPEGETHFFSFLYGRDRVIYCRWSNNDLSILELSRHAGKEGIRRDISLVGLKSKPKTFTESLVNAIRCLIFLKLTEPEIIHLAPGEKHGTRKKGHYNATPLPVIIVDRNWNKFTVRTEGFGVSGHLRMQPCGKGNADLKLIWISPFEKRGYVRLPKAEAL